MPKPSREYIYGVNPAFEVLRGGRRKVYTAFLNKAVPDNPRIRKLARFLETKQVPIEWVDKRRIFDLAQSKEHQGVVLKASPYPYVSLDSLLDRPRLLLLDNVEDPHNTGAIIRCADCFGFHAVLIPLKGTPDIYPSVVKVSAGATEHLDIARETSANQYMKTAVEHGYKVVALDASGEHDIRSLPLENEKVLLVIGGENRAVGQFILNEADYIAGIGMSGRINSLNASVAAGIAMYSMAGAAGV